MGYLIMCRNFNISYLVHKINLNKKNEFRDRVLVKGHAHLVEQLWAELGLIKKKN